MKTESIIFQVVAHEISAKNPKLTEQQQKALSTVLNTKDWEEQLKKLWPTLQNGKQSGIKSNFLTALMLLLPAAGATNAQEMIMNLKNIKTIEAPAKTSKPSIEDVKKVSEAIPMLTNSLELIGLTSTKPDFDIFWKVLLKRVEKASKDTKLKNSLEEYKSQGLDFKSDLIGHAFVLKVEVTPQKYDGKHTYGQGLSGYLAGLSGNHPKNLSQLGLAISKAIKSDPQLKNLF
jgi:hypothetical protein